jgi:hypothetical protein
MTAMPACGTAAPALPRVRKCSCDGSGWLVSLDRDRYRSPGEGEMLRVTRCLCLEHAPRPAHMAGPVRPPRIPVPLLAAA